MSDGISGFGTTISGSVAGAIAQVTSVSVSGMAATDIDVSTMDSVNAWKEFIPGMKEAGEFSLGLLYERENHDVIQGSLGADPETWTVTLPDGSTFVCSGYVKGLGIEVPMDDKISQTATIKLTGEPTFTPNSSGA